MSEKTVQQLWVRGEEYARQRQWAAALHEYAALLENEPGHVMAMLRSSRMALSLGQYRQALDFCMQALRRKPSSDAAVIALARALRIFNEPEALLECVANARWRERKSAPWLAELAMLVSTIGDNALAMEILDVAIGRDPKDPSARYFRGVVKMFLGDIAASGHELEKCIALSPGFAQAHWVLSRLERQTDESNHVARLKNQLSRQPPVGEDQVYMSFALHNELHDLKDYQASWQALERGCRIKRHLAPHDRTDARKMYEGLASLCNKDFVSPVESSEDSYTPIFIVGMHRSGSTLLEQLLARHPSVTDGGETYAFTTQMRYYADYRSKGVLDWEMVRRAAGLDYQLVGRRFLESTQWRTRGSRFMTEKLPSNFLNLGFIAKALPGARILHMVREPIDTCFSNLRTMFSDVNTFSYDQEELVEWFGRYRRLMDHWHAVMPGRLMDVNYDDIVADPEATMRNVLEFCGLPWNPAVVSLAGTGSVATASSPQMRSGIIKGRGSAWVPYAQYLRILLEGLKPYAGIAK